MSVVAVTGAAGSLGPHVARALADEGHSLALADRDPGRLQDLVEQLGLPDERVDTSTADLLDADATRGWARHVEERFGEVDGVAHLVGGWRGGKPIGEAPPEDYDWLHGLLVTTLRHVTLGFLPALKRSHGRFVLVSSVQAQAPTSTNAAYAAAKAAAEAWTLALADELSGDGGTANILVVNAIVTPQMRAADPDKAFKTFTDATDIAGGIAYLLGERAAKMNGKRLSLHP
jgi:NAD(P)-dependent dehydrogenase (short-subunit alcohol dehydrogenase family)